MKTLQEVQAFLNNIGASVLYKNSYSYNCPDWREFEDLTVANPVQRKLAPNECVLDFDGIDDMTAQLLPQYLTDKGFRHITWRSSSTGIHVHFFTQYTSKSIKKAIVNMVAEPLERRFGLVNDIMPMGHGHIRCEWGFHPEKGEQKKFVASNIGTLFYENYIDAKDLPKVSSNQATSAQNGALIGTVKGKIPTCMKYILGTKLSDGKKRLFFAVVSWYKATGGSKDEVAALVRSWSEMQGQQWSVKQFNATWNSCAGSVGCKFRHQILEELGLDMSKCKIEDE